MSIDKKMEKTEKVTLRDENKTVKTIEKDYQFALDSIRAILAASAIKYGVDGKLTMAEMSKFNRLDNVNKEINEVLINVNKSVDKETIEHSIRTFKTNYFGTGYALETELQEKLNFNTLTRPNVLKAIENPLTELALEDNADRVKRSIRRTLTSGIAQGQSVPEMAKRVKVDLEKNANNATRIARTETTRVQNKAIQEAGEKAATKGIDLVKKWNATLDGRTRRNHRKLDGETKELNEEFTVNGHSTQRPGGFGVASEDINCRCRLTYVPRGISEPEYRRARSTDGKGEVIPYTNYTDWYKNRVVKSN